MGRLRKTLYGHEDLVETYEQCLKTENERLDREESERKTARQLTAPKVQDAAADKFRKDDKFLQLSKKSRGTKGTGKETLDHTKWQMIRRKLQPTETTMVVL